MPDHRSSFLDISLVVAWALMASVPSLAQTHVSRDASSRPKLSQVRQIQVQTEGKHTRVVIEVEDKVEYRGGRIANPDRMYFDLRKAKLSPSLAGRNLEVKSGSLLKAVRAAQNQADVVRVVLEVNQAKDYSVSWLSDPYRLVVNVYGSPSEASVVLSAPAPTPSLNPRPTPSDAVSAPSPPLDKSVMNSFDATILSFLNRFAQRSWAFDTFMVLVSVNSLVKGLVPMALFWWAWFRHREDGKQERELLLSSVLASVPAVMVARVLAHILPFRVRPIYDAALHFKAPYGMESRYLEGWSSFPSDHAVLFVTVATGLLFVSWLAGALALSYVALAICLPRIYLGIHYPTDIIVGALMGVGAAYLSRSQQLRSVFIRPVVLWSERHPSLFYPLLFFLTFQIAVLFNPLREMGRFVYGTLSVVVSRMALLASP